MDLGKLHGFSPQDSPISLLLSSHGHPSVSDKHVLVRNIEPQRPQISLQVALLHCDHIPPGVHEVLGVVAVEVIDFGNAVVDVSQVGLVTVAGVGTEVGFRKCLIEVSYHCSTK